MTFWGDDKYYTKMDGEEARGGERGMHGGAKWRQTWSSDGGISGWGRERGDQVINGKNVNSPNLKARV